MQIFVKGIGGKIDVHGVAVKTLLECREGIPAAELLLTRCRIDACVTASQLGRF